MSVFAVQGVLNEARTGPFVATPAKGKQEKKEGKKRLKVEEWVSVENVSLKDGNISFSAVSLSGIYFTMAHSAAGDALAYSDGASLEGARWHWLDNETQRGDKPQQTERSVGGTLGLDVKHAPVHVHDPGAPLTSVTQGCRVCSFSCIVQFLKVEHIRHKDDSWDSFEMMLLVCNVN